MKIHKIHIKKHVSSTRYMGVILLLFSMVTSICAQTEHATHYIGASVGGGGSHLLMGDGYSLHRLSATPRAGGGAVLDLSYELVYEHLLFQTGLGVHYTLNSNQLYVDKFSAQIAEYTTMWYHYELKNYVERTGYGIGYIPVKIGATFDRWYFLAGIDLGLVSFDNRSTTMADLTIWATDDDIMEPLVNLPTHGLQMHYIVNRSQKVDMADLNAMLALEIGVKISNRSRVGKRMIDDETMYRKVSERRMQPEWRVAIFADYGLSNIYRYSANPVAYEGMSSGGLIEIKGASDVIPHSIYGYQQLRHCIVHNLFVGCKLSLRYALPEKDICRCEKVVNF
jgi:hypothetical protein